MNERFTRRLGWQMNETLTRRHGREVNDSFICRIQIFRSFFHVTCIGSALVARENRNDSLILTGSSDIWIILVIISYVARCLSCLHCCLTARRSWVRFPHGALLALGGRSSPECTVLRWAISRAFLCGVCMFSPCSQGVSSTKNPN